MGPKNVLDLLVIPNNTTKLIIRGSSSMYGLSGKIQSHITGTQAYFIHCAIYGQVHKVTE